MYCIKLDIMLFVLLCCGVCCSFFLRCCCSHHCVLGGTGDCNHDHIWNCYGRVVLEESQAETEWYNYQSHCSMLIIVNVAKFIWLLHVFHFPFSPLSKEPLRWASPFSQWPWQCPPPTQSQLLSSWERPPIAKSSGCMLEWKDSGRCAYMHSS